MNITSTINMSGYTHCACRDCTEIAIGTPGEAYCHECDDAGCPDYQGQPGMPQECQSPGAYDAPASDDEVAAAYTAAGDDFAASVATAYNAMVPGTVVAPPTRKQLARILKVRP